MSEANLSEKAFSGKYRQMMMMRICGGFRRPHPLLAKSDGHRHFQKLGYDARLMVADSVVGKMEGRKQNYGPVAAKFAKFRGQISCKTSQSIGRQG